MSQDHHGGATRRKVPGSACRNQDRSDASEIGPPPAKPPNREVRHQARGRGVGTALVTALLAKSHSQGVDQVSLSVEKENPALRLYTRLGFVVSCDSGGAYTRVAPAGLS